LREVTEMRISKILSQNRRDFYALYVCEHCGHVEEASGYDDHNFHAGVIPAMECKKCGKTAPEDFEPVTPLYPEGVQL
jgi:primosomal protein N'